MFLYRCDGCGSRVRASCDRCLIHLKSLRSGDVNGAIVAMPYSGIARRLMIGYKYRNHREVGAMFSACLVDRLRERLQVTQVDVVTWVPTSRLRLNMRGHDQAERIARDVARQLGIPVRKLLVKHVNSHQTGKTREQRMIGHWLEARPMLQPISVLVIDDVVTTGATLRDARQALEGAGAKWVLCAAVAATPAPTRRR